MVQFKHFLFLKRLSGEGDNCLHKISSCWRRVVKQVEGYYRTVYCKCLFDIWVVFSTAFLLNSASTDSEILKNTSLGVEHLKGQTLLILNFNSVLSISPNTSALRIHDQSYWFILLFTWAITRFKNENVICSDPRKQ